MQQQNKTKSSDAACYVTGIKDYGQNADCQNTEIVLTRQKHFT